LSACCFPQWVVISVPFPLCCYFRHMESVYPVAQTLFLSSAQPHQAERTSLMAKFEYDVDYRKLYPNVTISDEVLAVLKESDQKRKYCEYDLKVEKSPRKNKNDSADKLTELVPSREDSLDRLMEIEKQFASGEDIEADVVKKIMIEKMMLCVEQLSSDEKSLIIALFFQQKSEVELAAELGINQSSISRRKDKVLAKLKKLVKI